MISIDAKCKDTVYLLAPIIALYKELWRVSRFLAFAAIHPNLLFYKIYRQHTRPPCALVVLYIRFLRFVFFHQATVTFVVIWVDAERAFGLMHLSYNEEYAHGRRLAAVHLQPKGAWRATVLCCQFDFSLCSI